jgi:ribose transport system substrate-binding protein
MHFTKPRWMLVIAALLASLTLAACGSSSEDDNGSTAASGGSGAAATADTTADTGSSGGAGDAGAQQVADFSRVPEFPLADAPRVDVGSLRGKHIFNIPISSQIPFFVDTDKVMERIATDNGLQFTEFSNNGSPTQWADGINQAISQKVDLINLQGAPEPKLLIPQLKKAQEAGIPVSVTHFYQDGTEPPSEVQPYLAGFSTVPFATVGRLLADWTISRGGDKADALVITAEDVSASPSITDAIDAEFKASCPDCRVKTINVPIADWGSRIQPEVQSAITQDPNLRWILPIYDGMSTGAGAGVQAAGRASDVKVATYNGTPAMLKQVRDQPWMDMDISESMAWLGYANMDTVFRALARARSIPEQAPLRIMDKGNIDEAGNPPTPDKGLGDSYVSGYESLWGVR